DRRQREIVADALEHAEGDAHRQHDRAEQQEFEIEAGHPGTFPNFVSAVRLIRRFPRRERQATKRKNVATRTAGIDEHAAMRDEIAERGRAGWLPPALRRAAGPR